MICAICKSDRGRRLFRLPTGEILECLQCRTVYRGNLITGEQILELYDDDAYLGTTFFDSLKVGASTEAEPYPTYLRALQQLELERPAKGRLLDVGCSYGAFLDLARSRAWETYGVDVSTKAVFYAREHRGLRVHNGSLETANFPDHHFDVVTLWDVIEHLDDPISTLREVRRILRPGGRALIFTINQRSLINKVGHALYRLSFGRIRGPVAYLYDIHHNFFFCHETLTALTRKVGLSEVRTEWMEAKIERWRTQRISRILTAGCRLLDISSRVIGEKYRTILYVGK